jgi:hypothetical protein
MVCTWREKRRSTRSSGGPAEVVQSGGGTRDLVVNDGGVYWFDSVLERLTSCRRAAPGSSSRTSRVQDMGPFASDARRSSSSDGGAARTDGLQFGVE